MPALGRKRTLHADRLRRYSVEVRVAVALSLLGFVALQSGCSTPVNKFELAEENYDLLKVTEGACATKVGAGIEPRHKAVCKRMTDPRRYRGTWYVDFETSFFTPIGKEYCRDTRAVGDCVELTGKALPWPRRSDCAHEYQVEFVGRRNLLPHNYEGSAYRILVDKVLSVTRLPDPSQEPGVCAAAAS